MDLLIGLLLVSAAITAIWRMNLAMNHPEKYQNLREAEKEKAESRKQTAKSAVVGAFKLAAIGRKFLK